MVEYRCTQCKNALPPASRECPSCGQRFDQAVPDEAATRGTAAKPHWMSSLPKSSRLAMWLRNRSAGPRPAAPLEKPQLRKWTDSLPESSLLATWLRNRSAGPHPITGDQGRVGTVGARLFGTKRRRIGVVSAVVVIVGLPVVYNCWDSWFPARPSSGYSEPTMAQVQAVTAQDIPVTPAPSQPCNPLAPPDPRFGGCAPGTTAPVQQAAAPPVASSGPTPEQRAQAEIAAAQGRGAAASAPPIQDIEVPGGQAPAVMPQGRLYYPPPRVHDDLPQGGSSVPADGGAADRQEALDQQREAAQKQQDALGQMQQTQKESNQAQADSLGKQIDALRDEKSSLDDPFFHDEQYGGITTDAYRSAEKAYDARKDSLTSQIDALGRQRDSLSR